MSQFKNCDTSTVNRETDNRGYGISSEDGDQSIRMIPADDTTVHYLIEDESFQSLKELNTALTEDSQSKCSFVSENSLTSVMPAAVQSDTSLLNKSDVFYDESAKVLHTNETNTSSTGEVKSSKKIVKRVIILQPDDDADKVTNDVIKEITVMLENEAAKQIAEGKTPDTETVIEITGIKAQTNKLEEHQPKKDLPIETSPRLVLPQEPKHHRRKSAHSKHYMYHSTSCMQQKSKASTTLTNADCYFQHQIHHCPSYSTASSKLLNRNSAATKASCTSNIATRTRRPKPAILRSANWSVSTGVTGQKKTNTASASVSADCHLKSGSNAAACSEKTKKSVVNTFVSDDEKKSGEVLTNINWLGSIPCDMVNPGKINSNGNQTVNPDNKTCIPRQRPPFSYMNLILMAICDDSNKRKTLKQIYQWIEDKFPYYKYWASPSWKNSIRQNLSLSDIFINEKAEGRSGRSYWKLNSGLSLVANYIHNSQARLMHAMHSKSAIQYRNKHISPVTQSSYAIPENSIPGAAVFVEKQQSTRKTHNKKPVPLLPKVPQFHLHRPQPINNVIPVLLQPTVIVSPLSVAGDTIISATSMDVSAQHLTQQQAGLLNVCNPASQCLDTAAASTQVRDSLHANIDLKETPDCSGNMLQRRPGLESACKLLAKEEVQPEGLRTPPPMSGVVPKSSMKHYCSPTETSGGMQTKHIKVAQEMDVYNHRTKRRIFANQVSSSSSSSSSGILPGGLLMGRNSPSASMDSTDLSSLLSQVAFSDSGFVSDCSTVDSAASKTTKNQPEQKLSKQSESQDEDNDILLEFDLKDNETSLSDLDLDIVSGMEPSLAVSMSDLLWTPPKSHELDGYLTSTPFREDSNNTPPPLNSNSNDEFLSLSFSESIMNTSEHSDGLTNSPVSLVSKSKNKSEADLLLSDNYLVAGEIINIDDGLPPFQ